MNRHNLLVLADALERNAERLRQHKFSMQSFLRGRSGTPDRPVDTECQTPGCALGWAPVLLPHLKPLKEDSWLKYSTRYFIPQSEQYEEWYWCFGTQWEHIDNTPKGAAARIRVLCEQGLPEDAHEQIMGRAPLSYTVKKAGRTGSLLDALKRIFGK